MIRIGDRIERDVGVTRIRKVATRAELGDEAWTVLCCQCDFPAEVFAPIGLGATAYCASCAPSSYMMARPSEGTIVPCVCGASLDDAKVEGVWTLGDLVCEYRSCVECKSTRPYMPVDELRGRRVELWIEDSGCVESWPTLLDALESQPRSAKASLVRNGVELAHRFADPSGTAWGWRIAKPELEIPVAEWAGTVRE